MSHIRYKIHTISAQALIAYAKGYNAEPDRYHYHLNKRETESTIVRQGETYQEDNAIFFQAMCAVNGDDYKHSALDTVLDDLSDVIFYVDFKGIFDRSDSNPRIATRQKKAESMFRPEGIFLDFGSGEAQYFAFERSASMSRNARLAFIRADVYGKVHSRMTLDMQIGDCQLSKLYAYNGLMFSSGTRIEAPNLWKNHSIVVIDNPKEVVRGVNVITVEDATGEGNVRKYERVEAKSDIKVTLFDGEGLISKEFSEQIDKSLSKRHEHHSFQIRMPYIKGMVHEVDFRRRLTSVGITMIKDIWGNPHHVSEINLILTKSQLKGFGWLEESGYHWYKYIRVCENYRHALYVTGISKADPEEVTELNYQFLNTVSMKAELFRPDDLPLGWEHSPDDEERNWLTKATEQRYYDLVADEDYRREMFREREDYWFATKKKKESKLADLLYVNHLFINESYYARFEAIRNTFSSRVGQISNAALDRSIIAYDENISAETKEKCRQETETLAILTGLEIDSAKSGIKPNLSAYLGGKKVKRSSFLKYKTILESSEERRPWYEPTFDEQFKEYFGSTDWQGVSSNLEKLPYYAQMLKKNTPKAKRKPAKASELFTFATEQGWEKKLDPDILERIKALVGTYESCLKRIRVSQHLPNAKAKKKGINRVLFMRDEENTYDADELYTLFVNLPADRVSEIRRAIREEKWHFMTEDQRTLFLCKYLPEEEFQEYYDLFSDFRCGGYRLLGDLIMDTDNDNIQQNRARLHYEGDSSEMTALLKAYTDKSYGTNYRKAVAKKCLELVKGICKPSTAVKYVVALNKRSFLWDVLWESVEKFALKK